MGNGSAVMVSVSRPACMSPLRFAHLEDEGAADRARHFGGGPAVQNDLNGAVHLDHHSAFDVVCLHHSAVVGGW